MYNTDVPSWGGASGSERIMKTEVTQRWIWNLEMDRIVSAPSNSDTYMGTIGTGDLIQEQLNLKYILKNVTNIRYYVQFKTLSGNYSKMPKVWLFSFNKLLIYNTVVRH